MGPDAIVSKRTFAIHPIGSMLKKYPSHDAQPSGAQIILAYFRKSRVRRSKARGLLWVLLSKKHQKHRVNRTTRREKLC